jgi:dTDP-4-amino-4,6-dideoxygalactose transaminase
MKPDFTVVEEFEKQVAEFFGAPFGVAVDSCTHGIELALRYTGAKEIIVPRHTYLSVAMLAEKLKIKRIWSDAIWQDYYELTDEVTDAAVLWQNDSYVHDTFMCISFQYQKHLSLGRGGMILCDNEYAAKQLRKMAYDGREPGVPWRDQDIDTMGYHYYMTPDTAAEGLRKLPEAIATEPRRWNVNDWPDISQMKIFKQ